MHSSPKKLKTKSLSTRSGATARVTHSLGDGNLTYRRDRHATSKTGPAIRPSVASRSDRSGSRQTRRTDERCVGSAYPELFSLYCLVKTVAPGCLSHSHTSLPSLISFVLFCSFLVKRKRREGWVDELGDGVRRARWPHQSQILFCQNPVPTALLLCILGIAEMERRGGRSQLLCVLGFALAGAAVASITRRDFPEGFVFGAGTSAYQVRLGTTVCLRFLDSWQRCSDEPVLWYRIVSLLCFLQRY